MVGVEKIKDIEKEISRTQVNKATMSHLCSLRAKLAKYRTELLAPPKSGSASEEALRTMEAAEARLSTWITESELARFLTAKVGERVELTPLLAGELRAAARICEETHGAFDPSVGALTRAWGLRSGGRTPSDSEVKDALDACGSSLWEIEGSFASRGSHLLMIDEGGFGKGAALDQPIQSLSREGVLAASLN